MAKCEPGYNIMTVIYKCEPGEDISYILVYNYHERDNHKKCPRFKPSTLTEVYNSIAYGSHCSKTTYSMAHDKYEGCFPKCVSKRRPNNHDTVHSDKCHSKLCDSRMVDLQ